MADDPAQERSPQRIPAKVAREFAQRRVEIVRGLLAKGYSPKYGFGKLVEQVCATEGIPADSGTVSVAVGKALDEIREDSYIRFGKQRVLDVLGQELMELAQLNPEHPSHRIGLARAKAKILDQIADLEGLKAPVKHQVSVAALIAQLPVDVMEQVMEAQSNEEVIGILEDAVGPAQAEQVMNELLTESDPAWNVQR